MDKSKSRGNSHSARRTQQWQSGKSGKAQNRSAGRTYPSTGGRFTPPADPPGHSQSPWNAITVMRVYIVGSTYPTDKKPVTISHICKWMTDQLDSEHKVITTKTALNVKIESLSLWNVTGKLIGGAVWDLVSDGQPVSNWMDCGSGNGMPRMGYRWPQASRNTVIQFIGDSSKDTLPVFQILANAADRVYINLKVQWMLPTALYAQPIGLFTPEQSVSLLRDLAGTSRDTAEKATEVAQSTSKAVSLLQEQVNKMPSILEKALGHAAAVVPFIGGEEVTHAHLQSLLSELSLCKSICSAQSEFDLLRDADTDEL